VDRPRRNPLLALARLHLHAGGDHDAESSIQASLEKSARLSKVVFDAPPAPYAYAYIVIASALFGLFLYETTAGVLDSIVAGVVIIGLPGVLAGVLSAPLAQGLGGTLYYRRSSFLAAVCVTLIGATLVVAVPFRVLLDFPPGYALLFGYMMITSTRHAFLFATSDNRHLRSLPVTLLQTAIGLPFIALQYSFGSRELLLTLLLPWVFLVPLIFFLEVFDAPLKKNFKVSASEMFRYYLDHISTGRMEGEPLLKRFAEPITAKFGVAAFRRRDGTLKAAVVVPALHPGPIGQLGGSDLPGKIAGSVRDVELVMVPHGSATHDFNPVSTDDVERLAREVNRVIDRLEFAEGGSMAVTKGGRIRVTSQVFGASALLTYTSWPEAIDDVEYGVGLAAEMAAREAGAKHAMFVDCHNSLTPGAGAVFLCTPRSDAIIQAAGDATREALDRQVETVRVGIAQDKTSFTKRDLIGEQGVQVIAVEAGGQRHAYILWDGNNAVPEVTRLIGKALDGVVDSFQVMTTDNHSVNAVAGSYGPVGHVASPSRIADVTRLAVEQAVSDLEPVQCAFGRGELEDFYVFGHQKTVQLTASINVMTSIALQLTLAAFLVQGLAAALLFYLVGLV